jgi:hypothetical protein
MNNQTTGKTNTLGNNIPSRSWRNNSGMNQATTLMPPTTANMESQTFQPNRMDRNDFKNVLS